MRHAVRHVPARIALLDHVLSLCQDSRDYGGTRASVQAPLAFFYPLSGYALIDSSREDTGGGKLLPKATYIVDVASALRAQEHVKPPLVLWRLLRKPEEHDDVVAPLRALFVESKARWQERVSTDVRPAAGTRLLLDPPVINEGRFEACLREVDALEAFAQLGEYRWAPLVWADEDQILCLRLAGLHMLSRQQVAGDLRKLGSGVDYWRSWTRDGHGVMREDTWDEQLVHGGNEGAADNTATAVAGWTNWRGRAKLW